MQISSRVVPVQRGLALPPLSRLVPGLALTLALTVAATVLGALEERAFGNALLEPLVLALLLGVLVRNLPLRLERCAPGAGFAAREVLEVGVAALGLTVNAQAVLAAGPTLLGLVVLGVSASLLVSFSLGRLLGLTPHLAILVAAGNSICGNSAIAAVAPAVGAQKKDVASAIALTAVLGVVLVLLLPLLVPLAGLSFYQYGVVAGMSVYAVPQVVAASFPVSTLSGQVATLVKLLRVLLLGPVVLVLGLLFRRGAAAGPSASTRAWTRYVPWFVAAFLLLAGVRSLGLAPAAAADGASTISHWLTVLAMAGLGYGVELASVRQVGLRVGAAVLGSLFFIVTTTTIAARLLHLGA